MTYFECVICLDDIGSNGDVVATNCGHVYHSVCLCSWIQKSRTCPECRCTIPELQPFQKLFMRKPEEPQYMEKETLEFQLQLLRSELEEERNLNRDLMISLESAAPSKRKCPRRNDRDQT